MTVSISVQQLTFSGGETVEFEPGSIVVIVGSNNVGKSKTLGEIMTKAKRWPLPNDIVVDLKISHSGAIEAFFEHLSPYRLQRPSDQGSSGDSRLYDLASLDQPDSELKRQGQSPVFSSSVLGMYWSENSYDQQLNELFFHLAQLSDRLEIIKPAPAFDIVYDFPESPIQMMCMNEALEKRISHYVQRAFGQSLIINRAAGGKIPIHCGDIPKFEPGEDRVSPSYASKLADIPPLAQQGDGMRSFVGCLFQTMILDKFVVLLDEPEAFLHPPQARLLGTLLAREKPAGRQLIIATHSGDLLRGILDANPKALKTIRLTRKGNLNHARELDAAGISDLWNDPILRYSNILDSLFHEQTVLCESEGDCRFYAAILDAIQPQDTNRRAPDVMFTSTGGKYKLPIVAAALSRIGVPVRVVTDFDVLNNRTPLQPLVEALNGSWSEVEADWKLVKSGVEKRKPELETRHVRREIEEILKDVTADAFPADASKRIQAILKKTSPWEEAKRSGLNAVPAGQERKAAERLLQRMRQLGLFIVEHGELESFDPREGGHGNDWVAEVLRKDLRQDPGLENARRFVRELIPSVQAGTSEPH
jgi:hypothetical protein